MTIEKVVGPWEGQRVDRKFVIGEIVDFVFHWNFSTEWVV